MAGQALYRKWRSQTFDELVGQEHVVQTLRNAIRTGRIGHAYLFTGPRGVGKTTMARLLAKAVNCTASTEQRPCDQCDACRDIAIGRAVDVIEMDAASHTSVDDARDLIEKVQFRPAELRTKVYIIDETHMLSTAAFNALLKTLEEPPAHVLFILATTEYHKVPATIVSRCQRFTFNRHSLHDITEHLKVVAHGEGIALQAGVAEGIARAATGAMRDALSIMDQLMAGSDDTVTLAQVQGLLGAAEIGEIGAVVAALVTGDLQAGLQVINAVADNGADLRQFTRDVVERLRALMLLAATHDADALDLPAETVAELQSQVAQTEVGSIVGWLKLFAALDQQLKNSPYGQLPLEMALVEAITGLAGNTAPARPAPRASTPTPRPAVRAVTAVPEPTNHTAPSSPIKQEAVRGPVATPVISPESPPLETIQPMQVAQAVEGAALGVPHAPVPAEVIEVEDNAAFLLDEVASLWEQFMEDVRAENRMVHAQLDGSEPINIEGQTVVVLASKGAWQKAKLEDEKTRRVLERVLGKMLHGPVRIRVTIDEHEEMPNERKMIQHARSDALVRKALNIFEAQIVGIDTV